jgi:cell division septal protein FtsQ
MKKGISTAFIFLLFLGAVFGIHYGLFALLNLQGMLSLKEVKVDGVHAIHKEDLIKISGLDIGEGVFDFSLREIAANVRRHPLVDKAEVKRVLPNTVQITVTEKKAAAAVKDAKGINTFDGNGMFIAKDATEGRPVIYTEADLSVDANGKLKDDYISAILKNLADFPGAGAVKEIRIKTGEGVYVLARDAENTLFYTGKNLPDANMLNKIVSIAAKIKKDGLKIKYIDINKENAVGYK